MGPLDYSRGWLATAVAVSATMVLSAPFIGQLRTVIRQAAGAQFAALIDWLVVAAVAAGFLYALARIRDRHVSRYAALAAALVIAAGYAVSGSTGNAEVDAVERFHFIEYGVITALFYRAWRPSGDLSIVIMPLVSALIVGICEEWLQWFIPARIGEARDVLLNFLAIAAGLLFSVGLDPPWRFEPVLSGRARRRIGLAASAAVILFGGFFHSVHLGHEIQDAEAGVFRSRYSAEELAEIGAERARRWATEPPLTWSRLSREDQYLSEGLAHVQRRNETWDEGNVMSSRHENLILERYYAPVLDTPSFASPTGHRWPAEQRADAEARIGPGFMIYVSDALSYPVLIWPRWLFWLVIAASVGVILRAARARH